MNWTPCRLRFLATKVAPSTSAMSSLLSEWDAKIAPPGAGVKPRGGGMPAAEVGSSGQPLALVGSDAAPHAVIHVVPHPLPEAVLVGEVRIRLHLGAPALHDVVLHGPEAHAVSLHQLSPVVADLGARVDQAHGDVLREVIEGTQIDLLVGGGRARLDRPVAHVGDAVADHH